MIMPTAFLRTVFAVLLVTAVWLISYTAVWLAVDVRWFIDLRTVEVPSHPAGTDPFIIVSRDIHRPFSGEYDVTIRRQPENLIAYSTGRISIPYRPTNEPISGQTLGWWAHDGDGPVHSLDLRPGYYLLETCHYVRPWFLLHEKRRCVVSDMFEVTP